MNRVPPTARHPRFHDAHNHLQDDWLAPHLEGVLNQLSALPMARMVVNGTCENDWAAVEDLARRFSWIQPSFGIHPWLAATATARWEDRLRRHLAMHPSAAVGEIGVDRWILDRARPDDPRLSGLVRAPIETQRTLFSSQLRIAAEYNRVATIHCLDDWGALSDILRSEPLPRRGFLLHAYGGSGEMVKGFLDRGAYFSFNGYFLGDRKQRQQDVFRKLPLDRLLVETDAPSMPLPPTWRTHKLPPGPGGTPLNHPANIEAVYTGLAALRGVSLDELSQAVQQNFERLFGAPSVTVPGPIDPAADSPPLAPPPDQRPP